MCREIITDLASPEVGKLLNEYKKAQDALEDRGVWSLSPFDKKWTVMSPKGDYGYGG